MLFNVATTPTRTVEPGSSHGREESPLSGNRLGQALSSAPLHASPLYGRSPHFPVEPLKVGATDGV